MRTHKKMKWVLVLALLLPLTLFAVERTLYEAATDATAEVVFGPSKPDDGSTMVTGEIRADYIGTIKFYAKGGEERGTPTAVNGITVTVVNASYGFITNDVIVYYDTSADVAYKRTVAVAETNYIEMSSAISGLSWAAGDQLYEMTQQGQMDIIAASETTYADTVGTSTLSDITWILEASQITQQTEQVVWIRQETTVTQVVDDVVQILSASQVTQLVDKIEWILEASQVTQLVEQLAWVLETVQATQQFADVVWVGGWTNNNPVQRTNLIYRPYPTYSMSLLTNTAWETFTTYSMVPLTNTAWKTFTTYSQATVTNQIWKTFPTQIMSPLTNTVWDPFTTYSLRALTNTVERPYVTSAGTAAGATGSGLTWNIPADAFVTPIDSPIWIIVSVTGGANSNVTLNVTATDL